MRAHSRSGRSIHKHFTHGSVLRPCLCVRVERVCPHLWACVSVFERVCVCVCTRLTSGAVVYGVATVINTTQFVWRHPPDELGDQWWGSVGRPVKPSGEPDQLAFICLSLWLSVRFHFLFSFLYYCFWNIYKHIFLFLLFLIVIIYYYITLIVYI